MADRVEGRRAPGTGRWFLQGRVVDGTGTPAFEGVVVLDDDRIEAVHRGGRAPEHLPGLDVGSAVIAPGFIDLHTHSDVSLLSEPGCVSALVQGITTQVVGHCGFSAAPVSPATAAGMVDEEPVFGFPGVAWDWQSMGGYLDAVARMRPATNVVTLVGHNTVRRLVMAGGGEPATPDQLATMCSHLDAAMGEGAVGVSTGLSYAPGMFADEAELVGIAAAAAKRGLRYHTHMRYGDLSVRESLQEALRVTRAAGAALNVSHLYPYAWDPPHEVERLIALVDAARADGFDVTFDLTVFTRGGGALLQQLPGWSRRGGLEGTLRLLADAETRRRLEELLTESNDPSYWHDALIVKINHARNASLVGRSIADIAQERGETPAATALDLVVEDGQFWVAPTIKRQDDLDRLIAHPVCVPITDGMAAHPERHRALGIMPKTFGSFAQVLGSYVRDRGILRLEQAVEKLTRLPAERVHLDDRGVLREGAVADVVVFDPATVANRATEADPAAAPAGIHHVVVAGRFALRDQQLTDMRSGRVLRPTIA